jgi:2-polyprenyl-6-methoxyphenol hydroxylase-like FAD-dependent oxidoreductase
VEDGEDASPLVEFGAELTGYKESTLTGTVRLSLNRSLPASEPNEPVEVELLVGAEGCVSAVRMNGAWHVARDAKYVLVTGLAPAGTVPDESMAILRQGQGRQSGSEAGSASESGTQGVAHVCSAPGGHAAAMVLLPSGAVAWGYTCEALDFPEVRLLGSAGFSPVLRSRLSSTLLGGVDQHLAAVIAATPVLHGQMRESRGVARDTISGRTAVIGNAAHHVAPVADAVADQGVDDAFWLAAAMRTRNFAIEKALLAYQGHRYLQTSMLFYSDSIESFAFEEGTKQAVKSSDFITKTERRKRNMWSEQLFSIKKKFIRLFIEIEMFGTGKTSVWTSRCGQTGARIRRSGSDFSPGSAGPRSHRLRNGSSRGASATRSMPHTKERFRQSKKKKKICKHFVMDFDEWKESSRIQGVGGGGEGI